MKAYLVSLLLVMTIISIPFMLISCNDEATTQNDYTTTTAPENDNPNRPTGLDYPRWAVSLGYVEIGGMTYVTTAGGDFLRNLTKDSLEVELLKKQINKLEK